jgi:flagellin-like protein
MSAKTKRIERSQRFRRAWRGENRTRAVSPVVATLILILIAVAAAAALYLWLVVWQGNITGGIGNQHAEPTLQIGGSTSVYPFSSLAATWFEQNNTDVVVSDNQGGTGAGMVALCEGNVDLGASSTPQTVSTLESSYGCSSTYASTITIDTIAYDAVDVVTSTTNNHGLFSISADTLNDIYEAGSTSAGHYICSIDGVQLAGTAGSCGTGGTLAVTVTAGTPLVWDQIPATIVGITPTGCGVAEAVQDGGAVAAEGSAGQAAGTGTCTNDIVTTTAGDASPCGFTICAGPYAATPTLGVGPEAQIVPIERSDASGTTQTFEAKILGYGSGPSTSSSSWAGYSGTSGSTASYAAQLGTGSFANLGYGGCGSNNLLTDCGWNFATGQQGNGNPGVLALVAPNANAIGYASDGLARSTAGINIVPFLGLGEGVNSLGVYVGAGGTGIPSGASSSQFVDGAVVPTTGTSGTIAAGLTDSAAEAQFVGGRPFELISLEPLSGVAQEFLTFITDPAVNAALASATAEVGLYSVVP